MSLTYKKAGVDINKENKAISALSKQIIYKRKGIGKPLTNIGHYAGVIEFGDFGIALTSDGVGSKLIIANEMKKWDTIGIDCIAMNVNDLLAMGIEPIAFVDYIAIDRPDEKIMTQIGKGLEKGAEISNINIIGGETATLPDIVNGFDIAGACLGIVNKNKIIDGTKIQLGDVIIGLSSSGLHSNGFSLVRKIIKESGYSYHDIFDKNTTIGEELLKPTRIYIEILKAINKYDIHGLAHITGGGLTKLSRITKYGFDITDPIQPQPIFKFLQEKGNIEDIEMYKTFNMGMGFVVITDKNSAKNVSEFLNGKIIGEIIEKGIWVKGMRID